MVVACDGPTYESVQALANEADLIVVGEVGDKVAKWDHNVGGISYEVWEIEVSRLLDGVEPETFLVNRMNLDRIRTDCQSKLPSSDLVLFLSHVEELPEVSGFEDATDLWIVLGGDAGALEVDGDRLVPLEDEYSISLLEGGTVADFGIDEVIGVIRDG